MACQIRLFFKCHETDTFVSVFLSNPITLIDTHGNLSSGETNAILVCKGGRIRFCCGYFEMKIWPPTDEMMHARVRLRHPSAFLQAICWCGSGCFSPPCLGRACFYGNPKHRHKNRSGSLLASFCRSKVFTSISEGVWAIWKGLFPSVSLLLSDRQCLYSLQPCLWGVVCVWLMWISVWDWLTNAGAQRQICVLLVSFSAKQRKLKVPVDFSRLPSSLFCFDSFTEKKADPLVHYLIFILRWVSL